MLFRSVSQSRYLHAAVTFGSIPVLALATTTTTSAVINRGLSISAVGRSSALEIFTLSGDIPRTNRALIRLLIIDKPTMGIMLQRSLREPVAKIIEPITKFLVKRRVSANWISVIGGLGSTTSALYFFSNGKFFVGVLAVTFFVLFDLFDGAVARASSVGISKWGAVLDSTLDRISDAAIYIGVLLFYIPKNDPIVTLIIVAATSSYLVSYIRARAESLDIVCEGGIAERSERLIIVLITCGLHGLGVDYVMAFGIWLVTLLSVITILQRVLIVYTAVK